MINLKHYIIKKLGGVVPIKITYGRKENCVVCKNLPEGEVMKNHDHRELNPPETVFYGTSYSKLPKDIKQEDLNNWYKHESNKEKTCKED